MNDTGLLGDLYDLHTRVASEAERIGTHSDQESAAEARTLAGCARRIDEVIRRHGVFIPVGRVDLGDGVVYRIEGEPGMSAEAWTAWIESTGKTPLETPTFELRPLAPARA